MYISIYTFQFLLHSNKFTIIIIRKGTFAIPNQFSLIFLWLVYQPSTLLITFPFLRQAVRPTDVSLQREHSHHQPGHHPIGNLCHRLTHHTEKRSVIKSEFCDTSTWSELLRGWLLASPGGLRVFMRKIHEDYF